MARPGKTSKAERRAARPEAIRWRRLGKRGRRRGNLVLEVPSPRAGIAEWARHRREGPVHLAVKITLPIRICRPN